MNLIKNIPVLDFGIVGNRGYGFPLLGHLVESFESPYQTDADCELIKDQNETQILMDDINSEIDINILVKCGDVVDEVKQPGVDCFLADSEDIEVPLIQPDITELIVSCD
jgi:hypothetical protein